MQENISVGFQREDPSKNFSTSHGYNFTQYADVLSKYNQAELGIVTILTGLGVIGNILVLFAATRGKTMRTTNNTMINLLAISDLVFLLLLGPSMTIEHIVPRYPFGNTYCKMSNYLMYTTVYVTIYFMCLMSVDRFFAIVFPLKSITFRSKRKLHIGCVIVLIFACVINIQCYLVHRTTAILGNGECLVKCKMVDTESLFPSFTRAKTFVGVFLLMGYLLPALIICLMYTCIFIKLCRSKWKKNITAVSVSHCHTRAALVALALEGNFFVCWTPVQTLGFLMYFTDALENMTYENYFIINLFCSALTFLSSCLNPLLYTFLSKEYRERLFALFRRRAKGRDCNGLELKLEVRG